MAQWLRDLAALPKDKGLDPSTHVVAHVTAVPGHPEPSSGL